MPRRKRVPTIADSLQALTRQLAALTERVREAEAVKNAVDQVMRSSGTATLTASGKRRGRPPGSKNKPKPANGRRRPRRVRAAVSTTSAASGRRRRGRPPKRPAAQTAG